jgi:hypothetical protein
MNRFTHPTRSWHGSRIRNRREGTKATMTDACSGGVSRLLGVMCPSHPTRCQAPIVVLRACHSRTPNPSRPTGQRSHARSVPQLRAWRHACDQLGQGIEAHVRRPRSSLRELAFGHTISCQIILARPPEFPRASVAPRGRSESPPILRRILCRSNRQALHLSRSPRTCSESARLRI